MDSLKSIATFSIILFLCNTLLAEEPTTPIATPSLSELPKESATSSSSAAEEEDVPLDAWILPKKVENPEGSASLNPSVLNPSVEPSSAQKEAEEKRIYKALLENYKKDSEEKKIEEKEREIKAKKNIQTVFKKTALTKADQDRITKIKNIQRRVIFEQKKEFSNLFKIEKESDSTLRLCMLNYPAMGPPSELRTLDPKISSANVTTDWKNGLKTIAQAECKIVLYTGVYGRTATRSKEFLDKTLDYLSKGTGSTWKMILNPQEAKSVFTILYDPTAVDIFKSEKLNGLLLRKGGPFQEDAFSLAPIELAIEKKNEAIPRRYNIISFDLRDGTSPLKKPKIHHALQMASALLEASINRVNENKDETVILAGYIGENRKHPAFQILQGIMTPVDFLDGKACTLKEKEKELFSCDSALLTKSPRTMMGLFSELPMLFKKQDRVLLNKNKDKRTSEIFIAQTSLDSIKSSDNNKLLGASFDVIKGQQFEYSFIYVDLLAGKKE